MVERSSLPLRRALSEDVPRLEALIARSARVLCAVDYTTEQIEAALTGAFGVDSQLIEDGTYFVVESGGRLVACGGWSFRKTLFGGDAAAVRDAGVLDPATEAAKIRAFFVDPDHSRQGLGRKILERCEREARERGYRRFELMATRSGERLYRRCGYVAAEPIDYELRVGLTIDFVPMAKRASSAGPSRGQPEGETVKA